MTQIIPAIIPKNFEEIQEKMGLVKRLVEKVQVDVVDGKYAPVTTWPFDASDLKSEFKKEFSYNGGLVVEVDMMMEKPEDYIQDFMDMGARSFVIHIDSTHYIDRCIHMIKEAGGEVGLGIKPRLDSSMLDEYLGRIDFVQFMGNDEIGHNGVVLDRRVIDKIYHFHSANPFMNIQIDIGVNDKTAPELKRVGVSGLVSGSAVFGGGDVEQNIKKLNNV